MAASQKEKTKKRKEKKNRDFGERERVMGLLGRGNLEDLMGRIKSKVRTLKERGSKGTKKPYVKMEKSSSVKTRRLIDAILKAADRPGKASLPS